jgi:hypothetical protein
MTSTKLARNAEELCRRKYQSVRASNPETVGDHRECVGAYLGEDVWGDPGEHEFEGEWFIFALGKLARDPGWTGCAVGLPVVSPV